ncbi:MAG: DUF2484 family protein [Rhodobacteraceae bacterium]|nr:DUF2484 family protein [Paracoccaceae bacterium]
MTSLTLVFIWLIAANVIAAIPSKHKHWPQAYVLIALGLPLLFYVVRENGIWTGLLVLLAAASLLRWPVIYLFRWLRSIFWRAPE